ncbi:hypothetical protein SeLEV6574_g00151 [Synchytrium endobioticum]|uniref:Uncharacterized protein n=1 Tax=Synchytrium endobioticum TaxID=286115 RepID=A0A507DJ94_9FUNG|nr:hypothetical protein SeLEV6574_g00151 [Synchytrium endobioticum]
MAEPEPSRPINLDEDPMPDPDEQQQPDSDPPPPPKRDDDAFAHRHYQSLYPTCNRLLASKWDHAQRQRHLDKLKMVKPAIDNHPPRKWAHLDVKTGKKLQIQNDRLAEIERSNRQLLEKMAHIMKVSTGISRNENAHEARSGFAHDRHYYRRMRELEKINMENSKILSRLESMSANYDHNKWHEERLNNLVYLQNISAYPQKYHALMKTESERNKAVNDKTKAENSLASAAKLKKSSTLPKTTDAASTINPKADAKSEPNSHVAAEADVKPEQTVDYQPEQPAGDEPEPDAEL